MAQPPRRACARQPASPVADATAAGSHVRRDGLAYYADRLDRLAVAILRRGLDLIPRQSERDQAFVGIELERAPVDDNLPAPDAEKTSEVDDGGTPPAGRVDDDVLAIAAADLLAEDRLDTVSITIVKVSRSGAAPAVLGASSPEADRPNSAMSPNPVT